MSETGGMLDNYLIAQALGWDWNFWTMLTLTGIELVCFFALVCLCGILAMWMDSK